MFSFLTFKWLLKFIYTLSRFSGFLFISIDFSSDYLQTEKHAWNFVVFGASFGLSLVATKYDRKLPIEDITHSKILEMGVQLITRVILTTALVLKIANIVDRQKFFGILSKLQWGNIKVRKIKSFLNSSCILLLQLELQGISSASKSQLYLVASVWPAYMLIFAFIAGSIIFFFQLIGFIYDVGGINDFYFSMTILFYLFCGISLMMTMACATFQLKALNSFLMKLFESSNDLPSVQVIRRTSIIYDKLCDVFEDISSFFLLDIFVYLLGFLYFSTMSFYGFFVYFQTPSYQLAYFQMLTVIWMLYYSPLVIWVVIFSGLVEKEGIRTADLIQQMSVRRNKLKSLKSSEIMMQMVTHRRPKISCGLFDLNWKYFFVLLGSTFSFGIILIQFYDVHT